MGSAFGGTWEDPGGVFFLICSKKSFKTRPNSPYGGKTSTYLLLQQRVIVSMFVYPYEIEMYDYVVCLSKQDMQM